MKGQKKKMAELLIVLWVVCVITFIFSFTAGYAVGAVRQQQRDEDKYQEFIEKHGGFVMNIENNSVIDKIIAEIETDLSYFCFDDWGNENTIWKEVKTIIDKYKAESEGNKE